MKYIEAPDIYTWNNTSLFIAGWISNCPDWQKKFVEYFRETNLTLINPRRYKFDIHDTSIEEQQIKWEHEHLEKSDLISFWFPKETLCPITLFELWKYIRSDKKIFIWVDEKYSRKRDIEIQTRLVKPDIEICYCLESLSQEILRYIDTT